MGERPVAGMIADATPGIIVASVIAWGIGTAIHFALPCCPDAPTAVRDECARPGQS